MVCARVLGTLFHDSLRAHKDGIVQCHGGLRGVWQQMADLPVSMVNALATTLTQAQAIFRYLQEQKVPRDWDLVAPALDGMPAERLGSWEWEHTPRDTARDGA